MHFLIIAYFYPVRVYSLTLESGLCHSIDQLCIFSCFFQTFLPNIFFYKVIVFDTKGSGGCKAKALCKSKTRTKPKSYFVRLIIWVLLSHRHHPYLRFSSRVVTYTLWDVLSGQIVIRNIQKIVGVLLEWCKLFHGNIFKHQDGDYC